MKRVGDVYTSTDHLKPAKRREDSNLPDKDGVVIVEKESESFTIEEKGELQSYPETSSEVYLESEEKDEYVHTEGMFSTVTEDLKSDEGLFQTDRNNDVGHGSEGLELSQPNTEKLEDNQREDRSAKHGEFIIKKQKRKKKRPAFQQSTSSGQGLSHINPWQGNTSKVQVQSARNDIDTPDQNITDHPVKDEELSVDNPAVLTDKKIDDNREEDKKKELLQDTQQVDLGADIIVKIVIGIIAGIAGFTYIFTQLGLFNR